MTYNYSKDIMSDSSGTYQLAFYRKWLTENHEKLVTSHFVKSLTVGGRTKFYFDWLSIYQTADRYGFLKNYIHELHQRTGKKIS